MPNINELVQIAESLETKAVHARPERCVAVRNRHASCQKCVEICPTRAITVANNVLSLDAGACVGCGACTTICPAEALFSLQPTDKLLSEAIVSALAYTEGALFVACSRRAALDEGDPRAFVEVPCLARVDESVLLRVVSCEANRVVLIDGGCSTCKYGSIEHLIETVIAGVNTMLHQQGCSVEVERASAFPESIRLKNRQSILGESRRAFFSGAGLQATQVAGKAAEVLVFKKEDKEPTLRDRLQTLDTGVMPQFEPTRHLEILDALDSLGFPEEEVVTGRLFGSVQLDEGACSACGMCAVFCPTGALKKSLVKPETGEGSYLEFSAAECVQCDLCVDACPKDCLVVLPEVSAKELFDFEPRLLHLPNPPKPAGILAHLRK